MTSFILVHCVRLFGSFDHVGAELVRRRHSYKQKPKTEAKATKNTKGKTTSAAMKPASSSSVIGTQTETTKSKTKPSSKAGRVAKRFADGKDKTDEEKDRFNNCLSVEDRIQMQMRLRKYVQDLFHASAALGNTVSFVHAVKQLCVVAEVDADALAFLVKDYAHESRKHAQKLLTINMRKERHNDLYILHNGLKKNVCCVSNTTHGHTNVEFCIKVLALCFAAGFTQEECGELKSGMQTAARTCD